MKILALDPGTTETGFVLFEEGRVTVSGIAPNDLLLATLPSYSTDTALAVEMIASYGMAVGREVFETVWWIGRFTQAWCDPDAVVRVYRQEVKLHLCNSVRAKDANVRQAIIDRLGPPGNKKNPGPTYGVKSHAWAALGVALTVAEAA